VCNDLAEAMKALDGKKNCHGAWCLPIGPKAVSIGLRNCRVARFGQALKFSKPSQQLSKALAPQNPPQQLSKRPAGFAMVPPYLPHKLFLFRTCASRSHYQSARSQDSACSSFLRPQNERILQ